MDIFEQQWCILVAQGVACTCYLHSHESHDFTCACLLNLLAFLCLDAEDTSDALAFAFVGVVNAHAVGELAAEHAYKRLLTDIRVVDELER